MVGATIRPSLSQFFFEWRAGDKRYSDGCAEGDRYPRENRGRPSAARAGTGPFVA